MGRGVRLGGLPWRVLAGFGRQLLDLGYDLLAQQLSTGSVCELSESFLDNNAISATHTIRRRNPIS